MTRVALNPIMKKNFLTLALGLWTLACPAWPTVLFNPTNGTVVLPTNFAAANLSGGGSSGTATNLAGAATNQVLSLIASNAVSQTAWYQFTNSALTDSIRSIVVGLNVLTNGQKNTSLENGLITTANLAGAGVASLTVSNSFTIGKPTTTITGGGVVFTKHGTNVGTVNFNGSAVGITTNLTVDGVISGNGSGLTGIPAGALQMGTSTAAGALVSVSGNQIQTSFNGSSLTDVNAATLGGASLDSLMNDINSWFPSIYFSGSLNWGMASLEIGTLIVDATSTVGTWPSGSGALPLDLTGVSTILGSGNTVVASSYDGYGVIAKSVNGIALKGVQEGWDAPHSTVPAARVWAGVGAGGDQDGTTSPMLEIRNESSNLRPLIYASKPVSEYIAGMPRENPFSVSADGAPTTTVQPTYLVEFTADTTGQIRIGVDGDGNPFLYANVNGVWYRVALTPITP